MSEIRPANQPRSMSRRTFIAASTISIGALTVPAGTAYAMPQLSTARRPIAQTTGGRVVGEQIDRVAIYRGVPYAAPPVGNLRFTSPQPPTPWTGLRDASEFAPSAIQTNYPPAGRTSEDCLYANLWAPANGRGLPVLVYIHGGGWMLGSGSEPDYDGMRLAQLGRLLVVNFNYRLGPFGWGMHEDLRDRRTGASSNWGLQDQIALLRWVEQNARAFGGDPNNITLAGTSAGGSSTWQLALLPQTRRIIKRIVPISAHHVWSPASSASAQESQRTFDLVAKDLRTTVRGLRRVDAQDLETAWTGQWAAPPGDRRIRGWREYRGPIIDGRFVPAYDFERRTPDLPTLTIFARTEGSFFTTGPGYPYPGPMPRNEDELRDKIRETLLKGATDVSQQEITACINWFRSEATRESRPSDPVSLWTEVWGDGLFRYQVLRLARRQAREHPQSNRWLIEFAHPVKPPLAGTPHEATSKFLFGTHTSETNRDVYGDGPLERNVSDHLIETVARFARGNVPRTPDGTPVPRYDPERPSTLTIGGPEVSAITHTAKEAQLDFWDTAGWVPNPDPLLARN